MLLLFVSTAIMPNNGQKVQQKVLRWAARMTTYNYVCIHISGSNDIWSNLLTRLSIHRTVRRWFTIDPLPTTFKDFLLRSVDSICSSQNIHVLSWPSDCCLLNDICNFSPSCPVWVPDASADLQVRLCIIVHTGAEGHRGKSSTKQAPSWTFN